MSWLLCGNIITDILRIYFDFVNHKSYNKELSTTKVSQNYNYIKGRFV